MGTRSSFCLALALAASGCAGGAAQPSALAEVQKQLAESERRVATAEHKIDELENRVFLLTDQVESQKVAALHRDRPRLPVVTLKPSDDGDDNVAFEGAAAEPAPREPPTVLHIDGDRGPQSAKRGAEEVPSRGEATRVASHHPAAAAAAAAPEPLPAAKENLGIAPAPPIHVPAERNAPAVEPLALYRAAYEDLRAGRHDAAERGFREFVRRFPHHDYADNAQYWLGETFYDRKLYDRAAPEFRAVVTRWPTANKAPDALLKLAYCLLAGGDGRKARTLLREVPATYPHTDAARLAEERLAQLSSTEVP
jgi:tol-pal system protein YbgF